MSATPRPLGPLPIRKTQVGFELVNIIRQKIVGYIVCATLQQAKAIANMRPFLETWEDWDSLYDPMSCQLADVECTLQALIECHVIGPDCFRYRQLERLAERLRGNAVIHDGEG